MENKLPDEVQNLILDTFARYTVDENLNEFDILHLYDTGKCCIINDSGYKDARHFNLVGYNNELKKYRNLGQHDGIRIMEQVQFHSIKIFVDGSTLLKLVKPTPIIGDTQCVFLRKT